MAEILVHDAADIPFYEGPNAIEGIRFRTARQTLGVSAWGMNVLEVAAGCTGYPEHDHRHDGQEEVYVVLRGSAVMHADGTAHPLPTGSMVRVPPEVRRTFTTETGVLLLAIGGTPGAPYEAHPDM